MGYSFTRTHWNPDDPILKQGQPAKAVAVLMCMHLAIALVTLQRVGSLGSGASPAAEPGPKYF